MQELPDIDIQEREPIMATPARGDDRKRHTAAWLSGFVAILLSAAIAAGITLTGRDRILSAFGSSPSKQPDPYQQHVEAINAQLSALRTTLDNVQRSLNSETENANAQAFEQSKIEQRLTVIERFVTDLEQQVKKHQTATAPVRKPAPKKTVVTKPKPAPVIPPVLVSIRNISGVTYVALRDGLNESDLLMPGDTWKGWTFVDADHFRKVATFRYQGSVHQLSL